MTSRNFLLAPDETTLYVSGTVSNQRRFYSQFDAVVLLPAPADVLLRRIESRRTMRNWWRSAEAAMSRDRGLPADKEPVATFVA